MYTAAMGEIARCVCNLENFESGRVEGRVEITFKKIELEYSDLRGIFNLIFGRVKSSFTRLYSTCTLYSTSRGHGYIVESRYSSLE